ncbi:MAG: CaiB/BaiF CoA transferase family protein [Myxococcota bacterium]
MSAIENEPVDSVGVSAALEGLRVLDLTSETLGYGAKLLADLGADVVKVEPPEGERGRLHAPRLETSKGAQSLSFAFAYANANKRSLVLDLDSAQDQSTFRDLAAASDLIMESLPVDYLAERGLSYAELSREHRELVMTSITGFGQTGPQRALRSNDLVASALGGAMISIGHPEDPPVRLAGHQAEVISSTLAAGSSLVALMHRMRTGHGQHVDISSLEAMTAITHIAGVGKWLEDGVIPKRVGTGLVASVPSGAYRCKDGLVYLMVNRPAHWMALAEWIHEVSGNEEVLQSEFHGPSSNRLPYRELLDLFIEELTMTLTVDEAYHQGQGRHIAFTPVHTAARISADPQLTARSYFQDLDLGGGATAKMPGAPYRPSRTPWAIRRGVPDLGAATAEVKSEWLGGSSPEASSGWARLRSAERTEAGARSAKAAATVEASGALPLSGLRIVEFGTGLAAPWIGRILAWAGADVIKVESHAHPDVPRLFVPPRSPEQGTQPECSPWFTDWSAGKRFVALDLRKEEGAELARRIVDTADAVIANYSTGVLEKLGVGYETLAARNPGLVMLESSGFGESGPLSKYVTWGPNIEALSGLCALSGFAERDCTISHFAYPDPLSALHGLVALMSGLLSRDLEATGGEGEKRGQTIHLSQFETTVSSIGSLMLAQSALGEEPERLGNGEIDRAPYGAFPCAGEDRWCVIGVEDDADWVRLVSAMGDPAWASDARYRNAAGRVAARAELEAEIGTWTSGHEDYAVMEMCQAAGVAAGVVQDTQNLFRDDPQLRDREFFEQIPHFKRGRVTATGIPLGLTDTPGRTHYSGSSVGHDNDAIFREVIGLSESEIERLTEAGAIEPRIKSS